MTLKSIGAKMLKQNNRATQYPIFVVVQDERRYVGYDGNWTHTERREDNDEEDICEECLEKYHNNEELPEECDNCSTQCFAYYYIEKQVPMLEPGCFFTAEACEEHIRLNSYHYNNPKSYAISAWRNPEMQTVMKNLIKLTGKDIPSHYL